jgi:hypothetical protein
VARYKFHVVAASGSIAVYTDSSYITAGFGFTVTSSTSGMTATFTANFTSTGTGSNFEAQIVASGQSCKLAKL